jgi:hypothetical protein
VLERAPPVTGSYQGPGRDIMVQAWYQGGLSVFDFTDSEKPFEIAFFELVLDGLVDGLTPLRLVQ